MQRVDIGDGIELACAVRGDGPAIIFIHGALIANVFESLVGERALAGFRCITYYRRGYAGSSRLTHAPSMAEQTADCAALLRQLGITRAHVVGHSLGASIALQLALDVPASVQSLTVLEPGLFVGATADAYKAALADNQQRFRGLGAEAMVEQFFAARYGADWRARFERVLPGGFAEAVANAPTFFEQEIPGLMTWSFDERDLARISQPVLAVLGGRSTALWDRFGETQRSLLRGLPNVEGFVLPDATHALQIDNPRAMAEALAEFCVRHPR